MSGVSIDANQRITQDLEKLSTNFSGLVTGMVKSFVDTLWFTWRMKMLTGRRGVAILYAYMFLGLGFLRSATPDFGDLGNREQELEGSFRFMQERLRTHAESVAFFGGGAREKAHKADRSLTSTQAGELAHTLRFLELLDAAQYDENAGTSSKSNEESEDVISFSEVDIITPTHNLLARKLTCEIVPGKSLLLTGPNWSSKSLVFRALRGLWSIVDGRLVKPCHDVNDVVEAESGCGIGILYIPQKPYTCLGTLCDQIIYPLSHEQAEKRALSLYQQGQIDIGVADANILDMHLKRILENVKLLYLFEREGRWDASQNWEDILSLGEQQRLGMARLFFHKPQFGVLDECTNATSVDVEEHLYRLALNMGVTVITSSQMRLQEMLEPLEKLRTNHRSELKS
ncbi:hypothetical protein Lser_V15G31842 [Lactuca serriola]